MNFRKSSKGEGGEFPIQKFILQIFAIINGTLVMNSGKNLQYDFPKMRGGGQRLFGTFLKIYPFWCVHLSPISSPSPVWRSASKNHPLRSSTNQEWDTCDTGRSSNGAQVGNAWLPAA